MLKQLSNIALGVIFGALLRLVFRQLLVEQINFFLNPLIRAFWSHAFHHEVKSPLACASCTDKLYNLPN